jgi:hypothetical protein
MKGVDRATKHLMIAEKISNNVEGLTCGGYLRVNYVLGAGTSPKLQHVCHTCFEQVYDIGHRFLDDIRVSVKNQRLQRSADVPFSDKTSYVDSKLFVKQLEKRCKQMGNPLSYAQVAAILIPNTTASLSCFSWMKGHFDLVGDSMPNSEEIHLEPILLREIYEEYKDDMHYTETVSTDYLFFFSFAPYSCSFFFRRLCRSQPLRRCGEIVLFM